MGRLRLGLLLAALVALATVLTGTVGARPNLPEAGMAKKRSITPDVAGYAKQHGPFSQLECPVSATGPDTNLDCDDPFPNNEPDIEVDPADPDHLVASSNDYGSCCDQFYTSFDGGQAWQTGNMSRETPRRIGSDPVTVFDTKSGNVIHSSLSYSVSHAGGREACDGDLVVSISSDGGLTWDRPVVVDDGIGCDLSKLQLFNDKEWIVTDNNPDSDFYGRTYLTWSKFESAGGEYGSSAIFEAHSDDGGQTWSESQEISGSNAALCTFQSAGPAGECDENQFSVPTVQPDGTVVVAFENSQNEALWKGKKLEFDDQYLAVRSTDGGETWSDPSFVVGLEDGASDYPTNVVGRQTLTGYQVRVNSAGNVVADPASGQLYLVFADNRDGTAEATNTNVYMVTSADGVEWSEPELVDASASDQWFPWVEVNPLDGTVGVLYNDRSTEDPAFYDVALSERADGAAAFTKAQVNEESSNPTDSKFFQAGVAGCEKCATFHGDYIGLSYGSDGVANMVWTDMSEYSEAPFGPGYSQFIFYARR